MIGQLLGVAMVVAGLSWSMRADAQPLVNDVYADAKDIISELIERDVAESIASNLACYSPGGILKYFPETLQAIHERNFGAIKDVLRREVVALVANHAFESFRQGRSISLAEFIPIVGFDPGKGECKEKVDAAGGPAAYQEDLARQRKRLNGERYFPLDVCSNPSGPPEELELACFFAQSVTASMSGRAVDAQELLCSAAGLTASTSLANYSTMTKTALRRVVTDEIRARLVTGAFLADGLFAAFATTELQEAIERIRTLEPQKRQDELPQPARAFVLSEVVSLKKLFSLPSPSLRTHVGALRLWIAPADLPDVKVTDSHGGPGDKKTVPNLLRFLKGLTEPQASPGEHQGAAIARALLVQSTEVPKGTVTVSESDEGVDVTFDVSDKSPVTFTGTGLGRLQELHAMARMAAQFERLLGKLDAADASKIVVIKGVVGLVQALDNIVAKVKNATKAEGSAVDLLALLDGVARDCASAPAIQSNADSPPHLEPKPATSSETPVKVVSLCDAWKQFTGLLDPEGTLRPILAAARERNYRALAVNVVSAAFSPMATEQLCCGKSASCAENLGLYGRLTKSFVSYVLMPRDDADASIAARVAFKSAAIDVIRSAGKGGGFDRPKSAWLFPSMALRASWNAAYQEEDARGSGLRFIPTMDWPTIRLPWSYKDSTIYFAATFSLIDALAPLAEIVSRQSTSVYYERKTTSLLALLQPRVSAMVAAPGFSKHTSLAVGASLRGAVPFDLKSIDQHGNRKFAYAYPFESGDLGGLYDAGDRFWRFLEVSAAVQYTP